MEFDVAGASFGVLAVAILGAWVVYRMIKSVVTILLILGIGIAIAGGVAYALW